MLNLKYLRCKKELNRRQLEGSLPMTTNEKFCTRTIPIALQHGKQGKPVLLECFLDYFVMPFELTGSYRKYL